jgi:hypothetical protein
VRLKEKRRKSQGNCVVFIFSKNLIEPIENLTSYKPFSVSEFITNKISIVSKIDEIYKGKWKVLISIDEKKTLNALNFDFTR